MLQNEEFMAELQKDSEFMSALEMEEERAFYDQQLHQKVWKTCCYVYTFYCVKFFFWNGIL